MTDENVDNSSSRVYSIVFACKLKFLFNKHVDYCLIQSFSIFLLRSLDQFFHDKFDLIELILPKNVIKIILSS